MRRSASLFLAALVVVALAASSAQAGLVGYWPFDDGSGTVATDLSANANNGTVGTSMVFEADIPPALSTGTSLRSTGTGAANVVTVPSSSSLSAINDQLSVAFWMKATPGDNWVRLMEHGTEASGQQTWLVCRYGGNDDVNVRVDTTAQHNQNIAVGGAGPFFDDAWHHVAFTLDSGSWEKYEDGAPAGSGSYNHGNGLANNEPFYIFGRNGGGEYVGSLDDVAVWDHALAASDVQALSEGTSPLDLLPPPPSAPVTYAVRSPGSVELHVSKANFLTGLPHPDVSDSIPDPIDATTLNPAGQTATGTFSMPIGQNLDIHITATDNTADPNARYMAATFTAPGGYVFEQTGNQYLSTHSLPEPGGASSPDDLKSWYSSTETYGSFSYDPVLVVGRGPETTAGFGPGAERVWDPDTLMIGIVYTGHFSANATIVPGAWSVFGSPQGDPGTPAGLMAQFLRVTNNMDSLDQATNELNAGSASANHETSQILSVDRLDLGAGGQYGSPIGYMAGDHHSGGAASEDYAVRFSGYAYIPTDDYVRTFAIGSDDDFYMVLGDGEMLRATGGLSSPHTVALRFPQAGYWPIEFVARNRGGDPALEVSSAEGLVTGWNDTDFSVLGTNQTVDPGEFHVLQGAIAAPAGAGSAGAPILPGTLDLGAQPGDGMLFQVVSRGSATAFGSVGAAEGYLDDPTSWEPGTTVTALTTHVVDYRDPQSGSEGAFGGTSPWPHDTPADDNYFATKTSALLYIPEAGTYSFAVGSDDGSRIRIGDKVVTSREGTGGHPGGERGNTGFVYFDEPGLYPLEVLSFEDGGGSSLELSHGGFGTNRVSGPLVSSTNVNTAGYSVDFGANVFTVEAFAELAFDHTGVGMEGQAYGIVPALGNAVVGVESWRFERYGRTTGQGLREQVYARNGDDFGAYLGERLVMVAPGSPQDFAPNQTQANANFPEDFAYGPWGSTENDFKVRFTGLINIPADGAYNFQMDTDDRSAMFIDIDGDGVLEEPASNWAWTVTWSGVDLTAGWHAVEFHALEYSGGEWSRIQWDRPDDAAGMHTIPAEYFMYDYETWEVLMAGTDPLGDLLNYEYLRRFDFGSSERLRLVTEIAGLTDIAEDTFFFVPEPTTLFLLGAGLFGVATRRRYRR